MLRPVTLLLYDYLCWRLDEAGGWGPLLSGCSMLGVRENDRGGEVSTGVRYPLLIPCILPQALVDINGFKGKKRHVIHG